MSRPDVFDYVGMALLAMIVALWVAHFVLPAPPPLPPDGGPQIPSMLTPGPQIPSILPPGH
jgi:hypothetical protein